MKHILVALVALVACGSLAACGSEGAAPTPTIIPLAQIDQTAWSKAEALVWPASGGIADFQQMYDVTVQECSATPDKMVGFVAAAGTAERVAAIRVAMERVCPSLAHEVDDALVASQ